MIKQEKQGGIMNRPHLLDKYGTPNIILWV